MNGQPSSRTSKVDLKEFMEYYTNVGTLIDNDEFFSIMLSNVWSMTGGANPMLSYGDVQNRFGGSEASGLSSQ